MDVLVVGDWSNDGHGKTESIFVEHNLSKDELYKAYEAGTKKIGFDYENEVAEGYEESWLIDEQKDKLESAGINLEGALWIDDEDDKRIFYFEEGALTYAQIWLEIAKLGNPALEFKIINMPTINIGGYGLFY